eukprot:CAMPEP_0119070080 /NCGR_PEP_ID=MMETSP1178-20130426/33512_1 /TAXON_ID=33656 /ORGANISM="unid sp, Strain CCMP2000" /LENGTH=93 /DNA_ID=CAMNT_0007051891 /DNA_START=250 /DNA_END=531 /DNA_ORIENTATION=-
MSLARSAKRLDDRSAAHSAERGPRVGTTQPAGDKLEPSSSSQRSPVAAASCISAFPPRSCPPTKTFGTVRCVSESNAASIALPSSRWSSSTAM